MMTKAFIGFVFLLSVSFMASAQEKALASTEAEGKQAELKLLLGKATPGVVEGFIADPAKDFSPHLTEAENVRLFHLLKDTQATGGLTLNVVLAAIKQRQMEHSRRSLRSDALIEILRERWAREPEVLGFFRDALIERGERAALDLSLSKIWDKSLIMPMVETMEKGRSPMLTHRGILLLNEHHNDWASDATIPPRLSGAILATFPAVTNAAVTASLESVSWEVSMALGMLWNSRDPAMIPVLRPYLKTKEIKYEGRVKGQHSNMRVCDGVAAGISRLLGDKGEDFMSGEMQERDLKIAELEKRLEARKVGAAKGDR
ncbi:MAG: hypothetical protein K0Q55_564 [Verrucomicrobia bacterium]|nr:hypothetical protein [Verrucomicrobiota bacterium]